MKKIAKLKNDAYTIQKKRIDFVKSQSNKDCINDYIEKYKEDIMLILEHHIKDALTNNKSYAKIDLVELFKYLYGYYDSTILDCDIKELIFSFIDNNNILYEIETVLKSELKKYNYRCFIYNRKIYVSWSKYSFLVAFFVGKIITGIPFWLHD